MKKPIVSPRDLPNFQSESLTVCYLRSFEGSRPLVYFPVSSLLRRSTSSCPTYQPLWFLLTGGMLTCRVNHPVTHFRSTESVLRPRLNPVSAVRPCPVSFQMTLRSHASALQRTHTQIASNHSVSCLLNQVFSTNPIVSSPPRKDVDELDHKHG